jgi:hypothetical protein
MPDQPQTASMTDTPETTGRAEERSEAAGNPREHPSAYTTAPPSAHQTTTWRWRFFEWARTRLPRWIVLRLAHEIGPLGEKLRFRFIREWRRIA